MKTRDSISLIMTLGDPNGLGPELVCRHFLEQGAGAKEKILIIGPESALMSHLQRLKAPPFWTRLDDPRMIRDKGPGVYLFTPPELEPFRLELGRAAPEGGRAAGLSLDLACDLILEGLAQGVVTLPLNKAMLIEAGFDFPGHTEFLAKRAGLEPDQVCMHLCGDKLRVSLVTTHPPLRLVPDMITRERLLNCLRLTTEFVRKLGLDGPIAVCGLNPHAGEWGKIGTEEIEIIGPAVEEARGAGLDAQGPFPADTIFYRAAQGEFPAVLAMYHDQGLGPLKLLHFHKAVNVTLGLPFVRTSVDHGVGYDLAGKYQADRSSLAEALRLAGRLCRAKLGGTFEKKFPPGPPS